ncbi:MAG TPA: lysophospholipid acyltransferase family protein [Thermoanaerobaculia bacterium]|nr:lysophospholipid acyltransferase family protein [Thermoanaerobaculia bacterium]
MTTRSGARRLSPGHAPELGLTHRLLGRFHVTGVFWYQSPHWAFTHLPLWVESAAVGLFTTFFFVTLGRIRKAIPANLQPVLGPARLWERWRRSYRTMVEFAWCMTERYRRLASPELFASMLEGEENWREAMATGRGAILVTAHVGPWEVASAYGSAAAGRRTHVVREREIDPRAQKFMEEILARAGSDYVTHFAGDDVTLSFELAEALRRGELVALQGDRPREGGRSLVATLFGRPMPLPVGPAALARATDVPILPVFNFRERRFVTRTVVRPAIHVARTEDREADIAEAVHRIASEIEWAIRYRPHQWFCFRRLWD